MIIQITTKYFMLSDGYLIFGGHAIAEGRAEAIQTCSNRTRLLLNK